MSPREPSGKGRWLWLLLLLPLFSPIGLAFTYSFFDPASSGPPCVFDPPPGDVFALTIENDSPRQVTAVECWDDACTQAYSWTGIAPGRSNHGSLNGNCGGALGFVSSDGYLLGCEDETPADTKDITFKVSAAHPCPGAVAGKPVKVRFRDDPQ